MQLGKCINDLLWRGEGVFLRCCRCSFGIVHIKFTSNELVRVQSDDNDDKFGDDDYDGGDDGDDDDDE